MYGFCGQDLVSIVIYQLHTFATVRRSFKIMAERMIVTTGQENTMHSASGTAIYVTLARAVMKVMAAATPDKLKKIIIEN